MGKIQIVGLGPMGEEGLTKQAMEIIHNGNPNFLRTEQHDSISYFKHEQIPYVSYDSYYESKADFEDVYASIANDLVEKAKDQDINYFVPGHPLIAEKTVKYIMESSCEYELVNGMSFLEPVLSAVSRDPIEGLKLIDGDNFSDLDLDVHTDTIITQVYNQRIVSELKISIGEIYGDEHELYLITHGGIPEKEQVMKIKTFELDRVGKLTHETSIYLPKVEAVDLYDLRDLRQITRRLRGENGCPWDMEQTHKSMKANLVEEAYEVAYAIEKEDPLELEEELGDLLFQIFFHIDIASDEGDFNLMDVTSSITEKLIRRHPHVFSNGKADWDGIKMKEKNMPSLSQRLSHLNGLPALLHAQKSVRLLKKEKREDYLNSFVSPELNFFDEENFGKFFLFWIQEAEKKGIDIESALKNLLMKMTEEIE